MGKISSFIASFFELFPEGPLKNRLRVFLSFSPFVPSFVSDLSPLKGYELYYRLRKGDVVIDAGAFTGDYTIFAAKKVGPQGKVIAFEPDENNRRILKKNIQYEGLHNILIVPKGLWNKNTTLNFNFSEGLHSSLSSGSNQAVEVVKLDDELKKLDIKKVDVIKMDIEGAEIEAIQGAVQTIKKNNIHAMIATYHIIDGKKTCFFIEDFFRKAGYQSKSDFKKHLTTYAWKI